MHLRTVLPQYSMQFKSLATKTENRKNNASSQLYKFHLKTSNAI